MLPSTGLARRKQRGDACSCGSPGGLAACSQTSKSTVPSYKVHCKQLSRLVTRSIYIQTLTPRSSDRRKILTSSVPSMFNQQPVNSRWQLLQLSATVHQFAACGFLGFLPPLFPLEKLGNSLQIRCNTMESCFCLQKKKSHNFFSPIKQL